MNRREFLAAGAVSVPALSRAQTSLPAKAKITSSVVLSRLSGAFENRVLIAAQAGMQSVELTDEYVAWDEAALGKARKFIDSFGMAVSSISSTANLERGLAAARKLNCSQVILPDSSVSTLDLTHAEQANVTLLIRDLNAVKQAGNPRVRLVCRIEGPQSLAAVKEAVDYTDVFHVAADPGHADLREIFQLIAKAGYSRYVSLEFSPAGDPVAGLIQAVDAFRAALIPKPLVTSS